MDAERTRIVSRPEPGCENEVVRQVPADVIFRPLIRPYRTRGGALRDDDLRGDFDRTRRPAPLQRHQQHFERLDAHRGRIVDRREWSFRADRQLIGEVEIAAGVRRNLARAIMRVAERLQRSRALQAAVAPDAGYVRTPSVDR